MSGLALLLTRQATVLSSRSPHDRSPPAEMAVKVPWGGRVRTSQLSPQQLAVPSSRMPHEYPDPAEIAVKVPLGA